MNIQLQINFEHNLHNSQLHEIYFKGRGKVFKTGVDNS